MNLTMRTYRAEDDFWAVREFLRRVYLRNGRRELSWQTFRFDYWRWHGIENLAHGSLETGVYIWETSTGVIGAVLNQEAPGQVFLQIHPDHQTAGLEAEMLTIAEERLMTRSQRDGKMAILIWVDQDNHVRTDLLAQRGFRRRPLEDSSYHHRWSLSASLPAVRLPAGFSVRSLGDENELPARSWLSWKGFHYDEPDEAYDGWEWYKNVQRAPLYRRDLDLVAVAPDGELAACCTIWFDDATRSGAFEPVATHGAYRRMGLASALIHEGVRRLQRLGADLATVGAEDPGAHTFYRKVGFSEWDRSDIWEKRVAVQ